MYIARPLRAPEKLQTRRVLPGLHTSLPACRPKRLNAVICRADGSDGGVEIFSRLANKKYLDEAARRYAAGLEQDIDEDELIAFELGSTTGFEGLSDLQKKYKSKVQEKILKRVIELRKEDAEERERVSKSFIVGKKAYECGEYPAAVKLFVAAVEEAGPNTQIGGEAQLWLGLAYQACGLEEECIETYKSIEANHPMKKIKKQAENLRFIMEAPKLPISPDERVTIPLLQTETWRQKERRANFSARSTRKPKEGQQSSYWDRVSWDMQPPQFIPDKWYYRVAWVVVLVGATIYLNWMYAS